MGGNIGHQGDRKNKGKDESYRLAIDLNRKTSDRGEIAVDHNGVIDGRGDDADGQYQDMKSGGKDQSIENKKKIQDKLAGIKIPTYCDQVQGQPEIREQHDHIKKINPAEEDLDKWMVRFYQNQVKSSGYNQRPETVNFAKKYLGDSVDKVKRHIDDKSLIQVVTLNTPAVGKDNKNEHKKKKKPDYFSDDKKNYPQPALEGRFQGKPGKN